VARHGALNGGYHAAFAFGAAFAALAAAIGIALRVRPPAPADSGVGASLH
ncbi:MFS transporter, partial [Burkholderia multivorans]|nr:MFS transporter [Burkholderia multivorans]